MAEASEQPTLLPAAKPVNLIPVGLKEAALDSPSFRATAVHFGEQVDAVDKWLDNYVKSIIKVTNEVSTLENLINGFISCTAPPTQLSEAVIDHDYTLLALKRYGEGSKDFWRTTIGVLKRLDTSMLEPIKSFQHNELRTFKDIRRQLDQSQKQFDNLQSRYSAQVKSKEASALREDAFQLHEARKAYLKASMDFSIAAPQLRMTLDKILVKVCFNQFKDLRGSYETTSGSMSKWGQDLERIRGWSTEMENGERIFRRELQLARKQIEDTAEALARPSREIEDYSTQSSTANSGKGPSSNTLALPNKTKSVRSEKQGWLNLRTITGKPTRTVWVRRWFYVKNGIFGWLVQGSRSGGVEESERIGVLLCGVRPAPQEERRFCFEVKTKDTTIVLQAETQPELVEWMSTFDVAKQKALEDPSSTDSPVTSAAPRPLDPAFAISPPSAPEFAASAIDAGMQHSSDDYTNNGHDRVSTLPVPGGDAGNIASRGSFDISTTRRLTGSDREGESGREQASRIIQKLDLHRKSASGSPLVGTPGSPAIGAGGIASLISASHTALPVGTSVLSQPPPPDPMTRQSVAMSTLRNLAPSTLAPSTLANPPTATNLSTVAVMVNGERGIGVGRADVTGGMPSGIMANLWGSSNWGYVNRLERGEVKPREILRTDVHRESNPPSPNFQAIGLPPKSAGISNVEPQRKSSAFDKEKAAGSLADPPRSHRKTISLDGDSADLQRAVITQEFPNYYPLQLKTQDAQFRLLFPNVRREDKVVLVFRATWNPNEQQEFPGRVYVTANNIYFYSHHLGLVLITSLGLNTISEITAAPGRECDFLFLHLKETTEKVDFTRITIKTFLEPLKLLQRRLNFLVQNCNSEQPLGLESIMKTLIRQELEEPIRSPSLESWEDEPRHSAGGLARTDAQRAARDLRANVLIDQGLLERGKRYDEIKEATRFKLPGQPVLYVPQGMSVAAVEKQFDVSPKALFHVMFGDRSAVWQLLYYERRAQSIKQGPWNQQEQNHLRRMFEYQIQYLGMLRQNRQASIVDTQTIDVLSDHLCYVVTDRKTPWHLPYHQYYTLVTKTVITHVAKSKCKLAIYTKVDWTTRPYLAGSIIEKRGLSDLELDALDLADVVTDQVRKLGPRSRTKKAIEIFGQIGQQTQTIEFETSELNIALHKRRPMRHRSLTYLVFESAGSLLQDIVTSVLMWAIGIMKWIWKTGTANSFILLLLALSVLTNVVFSSWQTSEWWKERSAGRYMNRLGVGPDLVMSKTVHIRDLELATSVTSSFPDHSHGACFESFRALAAPDNPTLSSEPTARRLRRTRQHLGSYRHDLLVAMRVVNSIEKEMLEAEWEGWIRDETGKCNRVGEMMAKENSTIASGSRDRRGRFEQYCSSCREAEERLLKNGDAFAH